MTLRKLQITAEKEVKKILLSARKEKALARLLPFKNASVEVFLVSEKKMSALNGQYRKKKKPTDVLSFPVPEVFQEFGMLGSLVICVPVLKKQAQEMGHSVQKELTILLVHGVLHLLGYDHENGASEARVMKKLESRLLSGVGLIQRSGL